MGPSGPVVTGETGSHPRRDRERLIFLGEGVSFNRTNPHWSRGPGSPDKGRLTNLQPYHPPFPVPFPPTGCRGPRPQSQEDGVPSRRHLLLRMSAYFDHDATMDRPKMFFGFHSGTVGPSHPEAGSSDRRVGSREP